MADPSNFWKMVDRTKPSKLRVFGENELRDCLDYFSEIQSDSALPPNEIITASERLTLIRSEIDLRHADARHRRTQRLASWAIAVGTVSLAVATISGVAQYLANKPTRENWPADIETITFATPTPTELPTATPAFAAMPPTGTPDVTATPDLTGTPTVPAVATPSPKARPTEQRRKKRRTASETKRKTDPRGPIDEILRSLFGPKPTPNPGRR
jgi:hypothetical protein